MNLITQDEIEALPEHPRERFVGIESICRRRYQEIISDEEAWPIVQEIRLQYMTAIVGAAKYLKIEPLASMNLPKRTDWDDRVFEDFVAELHFYTVQFMLEGADRSARSSIRLEGTTRDRLSTLTRTLRTEVGKIDLPPPRIDRLARCIDAFEEELTKPKLTLAGVAVMGMTVLAALSDAGGAVESAQKVVRLIQETVGQAKEEQDQEAVSRLRGPEDVRQIESSRRQAPTPTPESDLDDDIPF